MVSQTMMRAGHQLDVLCQALGMPGQPSRYSPPAMVHTRIVANDLERYCQKPQPVTAVGICVLQTGDIQLGEPGTNGINFLNTIRAHNLRPRETGHQFNDFAYFKDKPEDFQFGLDEWISMKSASRILKSVLEHAGDTILILHGGKNDAKDLKEKLGLRSIGRFQACPSYRYPADGSSVRSVLYVQ